MSPIALRRPRSPNESGSGIPGLVEEVVVALAPSARQLEAAEAAARLLSADFHGIFDGELRYAGTRPFGSTSRATAAAPLKDCDRLIFFEPETRGKRGRPVIDPTAFLDGVSARVESVLSLADLGSRIRPRRQDHSMGLAFAGEHLSVDLVPVIGRLGDSQVWLPERRPEPTWIRACPAVMAERLAVISQRGPAALHAIRLLKAWREAQGLTFPSYALELLISRRAMRLGDPLRTEELLFGFWRGLAAQDARRRLCFGRHDFGTAASLRDPWTGANVTSRLVRAEVGTLVRAAREALRTLTAAARMASTELSQARRELWALFLGRRAARIREVHSHYDVGVPWFNGADGGWSES